MMQRDFMGVLDEQYLPDWAMKRLTELRSTAQEPSEPVQEQAEGPTQSGQCPGPNIPSAWYSS